MPRPKKNVTVEEAKKTLTAKTEKIKDTVAKKVSKRKTSAKRTTSKKVASEKADSAFKVSVVLQYSDKSVTYDDLVQNAKNKFQYDMGGDADAVKEISLYVKPEESKVYFVFDNDIEGNYDL